ncbi:MAG: DUF11 domain-containing protein, partial [Tannerella sp.]|nr:DUF11 domain-containing protein [Tannerella sp.]
MKKRFFLLLMMVCVINTSTHAGLSVTLGNSVGSSSNNSFPNLTVTGDDSDRGYVIRIMFTRAITENKDKINLPAMPAGFVEGANSTQYVRVINIPSGATASEMQAFLRDVSITFDPAKKGHGIMVLISETPGDAARNVYYYADNKHWYENVEELKTPPGKDGYTYGQPYEWWEAYNRALDARFMGMSGYLATITSKKEDDFIFTVSSKKTGWIGGTRGDITMVLDEDDKKHLTKRPSWNGAGNVEKFLNYWYWASGPEYDTTRNESNEGKGDPSKARFYNKITGTGGTTGTEYPFANWQSGEPNNHVAGSGAPERENYLHLGLDGIQGWNDYGVYGFYPTSKNNRQVVIGSIIEYEGTITGAAEGFVGFVSTKDAYLNGKSTADNGTETSPVEVLFGDEIKYILKVCNNSELDKNVKVVDTIRRGFDYVANSATEGGILTVNGSDSVLVWNLEIPTEGTKELTYKVTPRIKNTVLIRNIAEITTYNNTVTWTDNTYHKTKMFKVEFKAGSNGSLLDGTPQYVDFKQLPEEGVEAVPDTHYKFVGWSYPAATEYRSSSTSIPAGSGITDYKTIKVHNDIVLTANFEIITHTLLYKGNDETGGTAPSSTTHNTHSEATLSGKGDLTRTGAVFIGWSFTQTSIITKASEEPEDLIQPDDKFTITADTIIYAVWAIDEKGPDGNQSDNSVDYRQSIVKYDKSLPDVEEGTEPVDGNLYDSGYEITVKDQGSMDMEEATFIGWSLTKQADTIKLKDDEPDDLIQPDDKFTITADTTTFYAVWAIDRSGQTGVPDEIRDYDQYRVTYDKSSLPGVGGDEPEDVNLYNDNGEVTVKGKNEG